MSHTALGPDTGPVDAPLLPPTGGMLRAFTEDELHGDPVALSQVNYKTRLTHFAIHPLGAAVEYPDCGSGSDDDLVGHFFDVDPELKNCVHPAENIQYSFSGRYSHYEGIEGSLLGTPVLLDRKSYCCGLFFCQCFA